MGGHSRRLPSVGQLRLRSLHLTRFDRDYADTLDIPAFRAGAAHPTSFFIGPGAGASSTTGVHDTGVGYTVLNKVTSGNDNTAFGTAAMTFTTGSGNTAIGSLALEHNTTASNNTATGV